MFDLNTPKYFAPEERDDLRLFLLEHGETYLVAESDGHVIGGCGYVVPGNSEGVIAWIFVHPQSAGKGIGSRLVKACHAKLNNISGLTMYTVNTSQYANEFFARQGYSLDRVVKDHWAPGIDLYAMSMPAPDKK